MISGLNRWMRRVVANPIFIYALIAVVLILTVGHYIGTHPRGINEAEAAARSSSQSLNDIYRSPINAPHNLVAYGLHALSLSWKTSLRLSSALFWIAFSLCFYYLIRSMFGKSIGLIGGLIFAATPLFLVLGRDGSGGVMFFSLAAIMSIFVWSTKTENNQLSLFLLLVVSALSLYVPGMLLWLIAAAAVCRKKIAALLEGAEAPVTLAAGLLSILILVPLGAALIKDWTIIKQLALIPAHFSQPLTILKSIGWMALSLFIKTPYASPYILGRMPVFNIVADALILFGTFALWGAAKTKLLTYFLTAVYAVVLAGLVGSISVLAIAVPPLAIIMTAGLRYLFIEWRSVFPRNPLAKSLALGLMWLVVVVQLVFGLRYAVPAWQSAPATKASYVLK